MPQSGRPSGLPADRTISSVTRVIVKTPGNQKDFVVADDMSVRQFKEKLSAHFKCQMDQLVLVFMGRLLKDQDRLNQRGIVDGHTVHLVIKSRHGSRSLAHSSQNQPTNAPCHRDRNTKGGSGGVYQPAGVSQAPVQSTPSVDSDASKVYTQNLEVNNSESMAQMLENPGIQRILSNMEFMRQFILEHPDMQQSPEVFHLLDNSEILCQTLELAKNLAMIQEIMQIQQPAQNLEHSLNLQPYPGLGTIPGLGNNALDQSYTGFSDQMLNNMQDPFGGNPATAALVGQVPEQVQPSYPPPPPSQEQRDQLPTARVIYTSSCGLSPIASTNTTTNRADQTPRANTISTKGRNSVCANQQPSGIPALPSIEVTHQAQKEDKDTTISISSSERSMEEDSLLSDGQTSSQITRSMMQLFMNNPHLAAQMMLFLSLPQLSEQWRQQLPTSLQQSQLSDLLLAVANPKASQAILQIEQGLQLLATEAPALLPWVAPCLWGLGWLPAPSCSYPDTVPLAWNVPDMAEPKKSECCHKPGAFLEKLHSLAEDPSHPSQAPEVRFSKQMESLQAMGFGNHQANLQALIATEGDTNAAIRKLKRSQGY